MKWLQVLLSNTNSIEHYSFICTVSNISNDYYHEQFNCIVISIHTVIDRTLSGATTAIQSEHGSNGNEGVLHILTSLRTGALTSDSLMGHSLEVEFLVLCRDVVGVFYPPSQLSCVSNRVLQFSALLQTKRWIILSEKLSEKIITWTK